MKIIKDVKMEIYNTRKIHISLLQTNDLIEHNGVVKTVCKKDITYNGCGRSVFGDSYHSGYKPVLLVLDYKS